MERALVVNRSPRSRSRVTNGHRLFVQGDGRSALARRWRDIVEIHAENLGGMAYLSGAKLSLLRRIASLEIELERMEAALADGRQFDTDLYSRCANTLRRILESVYPPGMERVVRDITPTLAEILRGDARSSP